MKFSLRKMKSSLLAASLFATLTCVEHPTLAQPPATSPANGDKAQLETVLLPSDTSKLLPATVFFRGQSASIQVRNSGGVRFSDGMYLLVALVDTSGYSTGVQAKYQAYLLTEVALEINGKHLPAGAYGVGFIADNKFNVLDIGAHELFTVDSVRDMDLKRPNPLQMIAEPSAHRYRLYDGRNYVTISRAE